MGAGGGGNGVAPTNYSSLPQAHHQGGHVNLLLLLTLFLLFSTRATSSLVPKIPPRIPRSSNDPFLLSLSLDLFPILLT